VTSLPTVRVEVGLAGPEVGNVFVIGDPLRGRVGVDPIGGEVWTDITPWVRSWSTRLGASQGNQPTRRYGPGVATIVLNDGDRRFDADNLAGPYVSAGISQILPMVRVRITAEWAGVAYPIWQGFADDWVPEYVGNHWTYCTLTATDATKVWATEKRPGTASGGGGESSGARITRILNSVSWPIEDRVIDPGATSLQATSLEGQALAELQLTQDTEMGEFFVDQLGRAVFQDRQSILTRTASTTSQATFGDGGYASTGEIPYADVQRTSLDETMTNRVTITRVGGAAQVAEDLTSQARFLIKDHDRSDLIMQTDGVALNYAKSVLYRYKDPVRRFERLQFITPALDVEDVVWPQVLGRYFGDRITVVRRPAGGGDPITGDAFIRGAEHASDGESWTSSWVLEAADKLTYFTIGSPTRGRVGRDPIAF
jgi:hypothetical protein